MGVCIDVHMSKIMRTPKKVGVRRYATYSNCGTLTFTENKLLHWCLKRLVKALKFMISCFKVRPLSGCFRLLLH